MPTSPEPISIAEALSSASETRALVLGTGVLNQVRPLFETHFGNQPAVVVADPTTFSLAGAEVEKQFETLPHLRPYIFPEEVYAEHEYVLGLEHYLKQHDCVPIAVGSGVVNDLTKLAAHRAGRPYLCCATAASMDGYTAFGASITLNGSKQTFNCSAPVAVLAPLEIISRAPPEMTASGYADLAAKIPAGADWLLADALDVEPLNARAWRIVQSGLRRALSNPAELRTGSTEALSLLTEGLMLGGFAMQWLKSSRPASGAEHQFSHLWDMQRHTHDGRAPSHGFKVAIGSLAAIALYESLLQSPIERLDIDAAVLQWPIEADCETPARLVFSSPDLRELAVQELRAKWVSHETLRHQLALLKDRWPELM